MQIREWNYKDILRISEIEKECFPHEPWSFQMLASSFDTDSFHGVLAEDGGEIIGYGGVTIAADTADIANVAVTEPFRHSGVGTAIIAELSHIELYLKNGFKGAYARTRYYSDGEDCLVMVKEL